MSIFYALDMMEMISGWRNFRMNYYMICKILIIKFSQV